MLGTVTPQQYAGGHASGFERIDLAHGQVTAHENWHRHEHSVCCPSGKAVTVRWVATTAPWRRGHHASLPETHARRAPRQRIHLDEGAARSPVPDHAPGTSGPSAPRRRAGQRDRRSGPSQLIPVPDALSHTLTTSIQCCSDFSDCRRTRRGRRGLTSTSSRGIALDGPTHARATKGQHTAMQDLPYRSLTFAAPTCGERCTQKHPPKNAFPQVRTFLPGTLGGASGTRTHKRDASHLRRYRNSGHNRPFLSDRLPLDPAQMGIDQAFATPLHPRRTDSLNPPVRLRELSPSSISESLRGFDGQQEGGAPFLVFQKADLGSLPDVAHLTGCRLRFTLEHYRRRYPFLVWP